MITFFLKSTPSVPSDETPEISSLSSSVLYDNQAVTIYGTGFKSTGGTVELNTAADGSGTSVLQTLISWADSQISITVEQGALSLGNVYLIVTNTDDNSNSGYSCTLISSGFPTVTIWAASASYADVAAAVALADTDDVVGIPAGEVTWSSTLTLDKAIKIVGSGSGYPSNPVHSTIINYSGSTEAILIQPTSPGLEPRIEVMGITFDGGSGDRYGMYIVNTTETGGYHNFRIHHNCFRNFGASATYGAITNYGYTYGLVDNNYFYNNELDFRLNGTNYAAWALYNKDVSGDTLAFATLGMGGADFLFIEDNITENVIYRALTSGTGSRWVYRYNTLKYGTAQQIIDMHGDMQNAGCIAGEYYNNTHTDTTQSGLLLTFAYRGGTALIYNNNVTFLSNRSYINIEEENNDYEPVKACNYLMGDGTSGYFNMKIHNGYLWNNFNNATERTWIQHRGTGGIFTSDRDPSGCIEPAVDYWCDTKDDSASEQDLFTFTKGTTAPVICSVGDVFWNTSIRKLYKCNTENVWTEIYTPYTYPHPYRSN